MDNRPAFVVLYIMLVLLIVHISCTPSLVVMTGFLVCLCFRGHSQPGGGGACAHVLPSLTPIKAYTYMPEQNAL